MTCIESMKSDMTIDVIPFPALPNNFIMLVCGARYTGKSTVIRNIINDCEWSSIQVYTPCEDYDNVIFRNPLVTVSKLPTPEQLSRSWRDHKFRSKCEKDSRKLIVLDDCSPLMHGALLGEYEQLLSNANDNNVSVIVSAQSIHQEPFPTKFNYFALTATQSSQEKVFDMCNLVRFYDNFETQNKYHAEALDMFQKDMAAIKKQSYGLLLLDMVTKKVQTFLPYGKAQTYQPPSQSYCTIQ